MSPRQPRLPWRTALVYGLGLSGVAASRLLRSRGVGVVGVDRRGPGELALAELAADPAVELRLGEEPARLPAAVEAVIVSPGVALDRPLLAAARGRGIPVLAEVELAFRLLDGPLVGITGSNGKSTTTALTAALLEACGYAVEVCGNIGTPLSSRVDGDAGRIFVTELSSFQLETVDTFRPRAAALLNLSADHLDRHPSMELYAAAKARLFARQEGDDLAVLNADDPAVAALAVRSRRRWFSRSGPVEDGCYVDGGTVFEAAPGRPPVALFRRADLPLAGEHNLENAMAAALLARAMGAGEACLRDGLARFRGLPHRIERLATIGGVDFFDDSKATNLAATARSLEGFADGSVHLVLGGRHKAGDPAALAELVRRKAARLYLIGEAAPVFARALAGAAPSEHCGDLATALRAAAARAEPGQTVLLSPACASFDQYPGFAARGEHFRALVAALEEPRHG